MKKLLLYLPLFALILQSCGNIDNEYTYGKGQYTINWEAVADSSSVTLINRFWNETDNYFNNGSDGYDTGWGYWPQAHAMDVLIDAYIRTKDTKYSDYFDKWYTGIKEHNGGSYWNNFNDDMEWIALTMIRLYEVTNDKKYLETSHQLWEWIKEQWNEEYCNGGIAWNHNEPWSKNACSNGPASLIACKLYQLEKQEVDKEWAIKIYQWERDYLFNPATGAVYDNLNGKTDQLGSFSLSYNQGTFLGSAHLLYQITGQTSYLKDARKAAYFGISDSGMIDAGNNILRDEGNGDGGLFKGIFMRYYVQLILDNNLEEIYQKKFTTFFNNNADILWRKGVNKSDLLFGTSWAKPAEGNTGLTSQTSACMLIEAKAYYESHKNK